VLVNFVRLDDGEDLRNATCKIHSDQTRSQTPAKTKRTHCRGREGLEVNTTPGFELAAAEEKA